MPVLSGMTEWESKSALLAYVEASGVRTAIVGVGGEAEAPRRFYSFLTSTEGGLCQIAILSSGLGTKPDVFLLDKGRRAIVGHDMWLTWVNTVSAAPTLTRRLSGVFFEFIGLESDDQVVVLHELGATRIDAQGRVLWTADTEVVEDSHVDMSGNLVLTLMDQTDQVSICLETGEVSRVARV